MKAACVRFDEETKGKICTLLEEYGIKKTVQAARRKYLLEKGSPYKREDGIRQGALEVTQVSLIYQSP